MNFILMICIGFCIGWKSCKHTGIRTLNSRCIYKKKLGHFQGSEYDRQTILLYPYSIDIYVYIIHQFICKSEQLFHCFATRIKQMNQLECYLIHCIALHWRTKAFQVPNHSIQIILRNKLRVDNCSCELEEKINTIWIRMIYPKTKKIVCWWNKV